MKKEEKTKIKNINSIVDSLSKQESSKMKIDNFRNIVIKIPDNINADVPEGRNGFLFDSNNGRVYALNATASFIFRKIKEEIHFSQIVQKLIDTFDVDQAIAMADIQDFLYQLKEFGIGSEE